MQIFTFSLLKLYIINYQEIPYGRDKAHAESLRILQLECKHVYLFRMYKWRGMALERMSHIYIKSL